MSVEGYKSKYKEHQICLSTGYLFLDGLGHVSKDGNVTGYQMQ
jgi:hypothetical protein